MTRYALEGLLYRLSVSPHADRFLLKGALKAVPNPCGLARPRSARQWCSASRGLRHAMMTMSARQAAAITAGNSTVVGV